jgi:MerR family transcriptional regulator, light-induced transcriptional regulator
MNQFSISDLARYSGIKPHTIRMWEQRYEALQPARTEGNTRFYDNSQLRRLLNITSLLDSEYKVSELCVMPDETLFRLVEQQNPVQPETEPYGYFINQLLAAGISYDEIRFDRFFSNCLVRLGMQQTYTQVISPLLERIGLMWASNTMRPAEEHFISHLLQQKLHVAIDMQPPPDAQAPTWLLFLPEDEFHEIGLLYAYYLVRLAGQKAIYLGSNVPSASLDVVIHTANPQHLLFFQVHSQEKNEAQDYINRLAQTHPNRRIYLAGAEQQLEMLTAPKNFRWLTASSDLEQLLRLK